jgi:hypothetical protein
MGWDRRPRLDSGFGGGGFGFVLPVAVLMEVLALAGALDESGEKRSCMEGSRCCEDVAFVLVVFGPVVDRRACACPRWLAVILAFSVDDTGDDDDAVEEAPRNSSHEESPVDRGSSSSSSSPSLGVPPVRGGGKSDEYNCFGFVLSDEVSDDEVGLDPGDLVLDFALFDSFERSGEDPAEAEAGAADDASSCAL